MAKLNIMNEKWERERDRKQQRIHSSYHKNWVFHMVFELKNKLISMFFFFFNYAKQQQQQNLGSIIVFFF